MNWIQHPVILESARVRLVPLAHEHFDELITASSDEQVWEFLSKSGYDADVLRTELQSALLKRMNGEEYPFVIIDKLTNKIIGCTRYMDIYPEHRKLEIGWTWYNPAYWGTGYNNECKLLLLTHAFEVLQCVRVCFKTWDKNQRSRAAILKIGAQYEGTLRNERIRYDGTIRNTLVFSIIDAEWQDVKANLINIMAN
ncbi:hypothetical protein CAP35_09805 [Chitinophagaceae bacterium IBVUCB1]|nr:hypothetical protein CAP35_09805 [Chitinophagaceae bacterium IBVUCB1]